MLGSAYFNEHGATFIEVMVVLILLSGSTVLHTRVIIKTQQLLREQLSTAKASQELFNDLQTQIVIQSEF